MHEVSLLDFQMSEYIEAAKSILTFVALLGLTVIVTLKYKSSK